MNRTKRHPSLIIPSSALITPDEARRVRSKQNHILVNLMALGIFPEIAGGAGGTNVVGDVVTQTADGRDLNAIWQEYQASLASFNEARDRLMALLTFGVSTPIEDVLQGGDTVNFEDATEQGVPRGVRLGGPTYFSLGYTFKWYDVATRFSWMFLAEATTTQVDTIHNAVMEADNRLLFNGAMRALFNNVTRSAHIKQQNYNVFPLYNGDATQPPAWKGVYPTAPHTHYLVSGATSVEPGDFDDAEAHLKHHGYSWQTGTAMVAFFNSGNIGPISAFRAGTAGAKYDFIPSQGTPSWMLPSQLATAAFQTQGQAPPSVWRGLPVSGRYGPWLIIEEDLIPLGYGLFSASGGDNSVANPVGVREHANAALRGLRLVKGPQPDYPLIDAYYQRGFGTGIRQRGAAVIMQLKASGSYDIPAAYVNVA